MVLEAIDRALITDRQEGLPLPDSLTIEHVLPQSAEPRDWPFPDEFKVQGIDSFEGIDGHLHDLRERVLHTFGNLTLLTQGLNSSVSNGPFVRKRPAITAQSQLLLNAYFQRFGDGDRWAAPEILVRGQELFKVALGVWPRPTLEAVGSS